MKGEGRNIPSRSTTIRTRSQLYDDNDPKIMLATMSVQAVVDVLVLREAACLVESRVSDAQVHQERRGSWFRIK